MDKRVVVGVIGAGRIGKLHIDNIGHKINDVKLKIVCDIAIDDQTRKWMSNMGISTFTDNANDIFSDPDIDAVVIASSTNTHAKFIQQAANAGKHVFCEKPIDTDINRIKETMILVEKLGIKFMVGFNRRFDHNFHRAHEAVKSGQIGKPYIIKITSRDPSPPPIDYIKVSGGIFMDMTIHDWDMARFLAGSEVEEVYANGAVLVDPKIGKAGDIDTAVAVLKFKNGALAIIDNSRQAVYGYDQRVEVFGSSGCVIADNEATNTVKIYTAECTNIDKIPNFFLERYMESYATELKYFFECIKNDQFPRPNGKDGLQNVLIARAAQKSFEENRPVKMSEINQ